MTIFDIILIIILAGFTFSGLYFGLIRTFGSLLGVILGAWIASHYYLVVSEWIEPLFFGYNNLGKVMVFLILFGLINRLVCLLFVLLDRAFDFISIIPFLKTINRLVGAVLGFLEGALVLGLILYVASKYAIIGNWFGQWMIDSQMIPYLMKFNAMLLPLLPEMLKKLQSVIPYSR